MVGVINFRSCSQDSNLRLIYLLLNGRYIGMLWLVNLTNCNLVPRGNDPFGQHQESRPLAPPNIGSPWLTDSLNKSDKSHWLKIKLQNEYSAHAEYLVWPEVIDCWCWPKRSWPLGIWMDKMQGVYFMNSVNIFYFIIDVHVDRLLFSECTLMNYVIKTFCLIPFCRQRIISSLVQRLQPSCKP